MVVARAGKWHSNFVMYLRTALGGTSRAAERNRARAVRFTAEHFVSAQ